MSCSRSSASPARPSHPAGQIVEAGGVLAVQRLEGGPVTGPDAAGQVQIGASHVSCGLRRGHGGGVDPRPDRRCQPAGWFGSGASREETGIAPTVPPTALGLDLRFALRPAHPREVPDAAADDRQPLGDQQRPLQARSRIAAQLPAGGDDAVVGKAGLAGLTHDVADRAGGARAGPPAARRRRRW